MYRPLLSLVFLSLLLACQDKAGADGPDNPNGVSDAAPGSDSSNLPDAAAGIIPGSLAINEVVAMPAGDGVDWIEFVAIGEGTVALSGYSFVDDNDSHEHVALPDLMLNPGDFFVMERGDAPSQFGFGLGRADGVRLFDQGEIVDQVDWLEGDAPEGGSYGRIPDGDGEWRTTEPTPGASNRAAAPGSGDSTELFPWDRVLSVELILSAEAWNAMRSDPLAEEYYSGGIVLDGTRVDQVAIRVKGNSSLNSVARSNSERYSFKVDINRNVADQTLRGVKKLNFNNGFKDPTFMREYLGYDLIRRAGMIGSRTAFVDLTVAGQHMGLYTMIEQVDDEFLERNFANDEGDLYKPEPQSGFLRYEGPEIQSYRTIGIENNEDSTDHSAFLRFIGVLHGEVDGNLEDVLNVDAALRNLALNTVMVNLDSYLGMGHNYYLYEQEGVFVDIPWDLNETYGNFTCQCSRDGLVNLRIDEPTCGPLSERPLVARLLNDPAYLERYHQILEELIDGPAGLDTMVSTIETAAQLIRPFVERDPTKFFTTEAFETGLRDDVQGGRGGGGWGLSSFIRDRNEAIRRQLTGSDPSTNGGNGSCSGRNQGMNMGSEPPGGNSGNNCPPCGDGVCDDFETNNPDVCPRDCMSPPAGGDWCGDGICDALEQCERSCPADCD